MCVFFFFVFVFVFVFVFLLPLVLHLLICYAFISLNLSMGKFSRQQIGIKCQILFSGKKIKKKIFQHNMLCINILSSVVIFSQQC